MSCNIAFLISAHTDAPQLKRLIEALPADADFFVHIDAKSDITPFTLLIKSDNVHFLVNRVDVRWGTMREVEYQMRLLCAAVEFPRHFDRIFFLSGMDYPLWTPEQIVAWLSAQGEREILQGVCLDSPDINALQHEMYTVARPFYESVKLSILARKILRLTGYRKKLHFTVDGAEWRLYKGSAWWCISQELALHLLDVYYNKPEVSRYFRNSFCPAETLIQTIAFNSPRWASRCILTEGAYPGLAALTPLHFIDYEPVIQIMTEADLPRLRQSGKMFCRKVVSGKSDKLVEILKNYSITDV